MGRERTASLQFLSTVKAAQRRLQLRPRLYTVHDPAYELPGKFLLDRSIHNGRIDGTTEHDSKDDPALQQGRSDASCISEVTPPFYSGDLFFESEGSDEENAFVVDKDDFIEMDITLFGRLGKSETAISMYRILNTESWSSPGTEEKLSNVAKKVSPELVVEVIKLLRNAPLALSFLNWAKVQEGYEPRAEAYSSVIARFGRERDFNSAWRLLVEMKDCKLPVDFTFSILLHRLKRARRVHGLVKAMCGMSFLGVTPTVALYTSALEYLLKFGFGDDATHLYHRMMQNALVPDKKLFEVLVLGFVKLGKLDDGLLLFNDMKNRGYVPHVLVYKALISSMSVAKMLDKGHELFEEMLATGCVPKVFGVNEIACALHGQDTMKIERFLKLVTRVRYKWKIQSHNNLLQCLFDYGRYDEAKAVFDKVAREEEARANRRKDFINGYWDLSSYHIYIIGMCKLGQLNLAMDMFKLLLEKKRLKPINEISSFLLLSLSNANRIDEALAFCKHITGAREPVSVDAQVSFFSALRTSEHLSVALKIFASMKRKGCIDKDADFVSLIGMENKDDEVSLTV
ncbi:hypothetical protein GOP47_0003006 [Adiantum capillus-veneris]|uniref:Pentatricopeptide repeat-containing protein n=1 Tax=Adiantum capillus-veneris TaxID=13818 RepID=A0A9D4VBM0_ADICA|nr:hypothetical protein GOP47_0003006 [Adiantum capillus-veneris]